MFNIKNITIKTLSSLLFATAFVMLHIPFYEWWRGTELGHAISLIPSTVVNDILATVLMIIGVGVAYKLPAHLNDSGKRFGRIFSACVLFVIMVERIEFREAFVHFKAIPFFCYSDSLLPMLITFIVASTNKISIHRTKNGSVTLKHMLYDDTDDTDRLERQDRAKHIFNFLKKHNGYYKGATGIAIIGEWGTGKSWLLEKIKKLLSDDKQICIDFRPWIYGETNITRNFYLTLERELNLQGIHISDLQQAVLEIDNDGMGGLGRIVMSMLNVISKNQGREKILDNIKRQLISNGKPIYIFIDDCDRLAHDEMIQLFGLIRNTGDFPLITYIITFNKAIVEHTLEQDGGISYVSKMFNLQEVLPPVTDDMTVDYISEHINDIIGNQETFDKQFRNIHISQYLPTIRETKKYLNLLLSDYENLKDRLTTYFINYGDFCLLELLKYTYPDLYYNLRDFPEKYLNYENKGWNSPVGIVKKDILRNEHGKHELMHALFNVTDDSSKDSIRLRGISDKDYFSLYFEGQYDDLYVKERDIKKAIEENVFPQTLGQWIDDGYTGTLGILCHAINCIPTRDALLAMATYLWHLCEKSNGVSEFGEMSAGYSRNDKHLYKYILEKRNNTPQIHLITYQLLGTMAVDQEVFNDIEGLSRESEYTLELMAIWMQELRETSDLDFPYSEVLYFVEILWDKIRKEAKQDNSYTLNVIDIMGDCTLEDTFKKFALPLITEDPQRWLGATVMEIKDKNTYYILKNNTTHAIFGSIDNIDSAMRDICNTAKPENKKYVEEYSELIERLAAMTIYRKASDIPEKYRIPSAIREEKFPTLSASKFIGLDDTDSIENVIERMQDLPFWKGDDIRTARYNVDYTFQTSL